MTSLYATAVIYSVHNKGSHGGKGFGKKNAAIELNLWVFLLVIEIILFLDLKEDYLI